MRTSARRWLLQRRKPKTKPLIMHTDYPDLYQRTSWPDFKHKMLKTIDLDIRVDLGEISLNELLLQQETKPLPVVLAEAETIADERYWWWTGETAGVACAGVDQYATQPMPVEV